MNDINDFANWLQDQLDRRGWDELDLAVESSISEQTIKNWLRGDCSPNLYSFLIIIRTFGKRIEIVDDK